jgi:hypothetical protein
MGGAGAGGEKAAEKVPKKLAKGEKEPKENDELMSLSVSALRELCRARDEAVSGSKKDLIQRLTWPAKAQLLIERAQRGQYVPKPNSANAALMVQMYERAMLPVRAPARLQVSANECKRQVLCVCFIATQA